ncbi:MAG: extracellular solute-binding protein [Candidatus Methylacidiphilales bacterium]|nr:VWA domain-containing protein [Candidatus Methylacidiphilales bacterium]
MLVWKVLAVALVISGCSPSSAPDASAPEKPAGQAQAPAGAVQLVFTYGSEKEEWIKDVTTSFNASGARTASGKPIFVTAIPMGSGECVDEILNETRKPHLVSPASGVFIKLGNAQSRQKTGKDLVVGEAENLVLSPVVIAMWKPMAEALGWGKKPVGWEDILAVAKSPNGWAAFGQPQWGDFRFGHTHPQFSNSGIISVLAEVYAASGKVKNLTLDDVQSAKVADALQGIEQSVVHYGSSTGFFGKKMFTNGPKYLSAAVLYESSVIESYSSQFTPAFPVVAIYPKEGTFWSDHPVGIVARDWVSEEQRAAARIYISYLLAKPQQEKAITYGFRPSMVEIPIASPIDTAHGVDPKEPRTTLEIPSTDVMDSILTLWGKAKKHSSITLVLDTSGSMEKDGRMANAREGALTMLSALSDDDVFGLLPFSTKPIWVSEGAPLKQSREKMKTAISGLMESGTTVLYDAIGIAYDKLLQQRKTNPGRIDALVVLTDGADNKSDISLEQLLEKVRYDNEGKTIRIFIIGYGDEAEKDKLKKIADATQGKYYDGTPQNIRQVFRDISTFF